MAARLAFALVLVAATAAAGPYKETLKKDEVLAIEKAIQDALPKPDQKLVPKCNELLDAYNKAPDDPKSLDNVAQAAACYRTAGSLGAAIQMWNIVQKYGPAKEPLAHDAVLGLAELYEMAAYFDRAAEKYDELVKKYAKDDNQTKERFSRAICIWRQLGDADRANRDVQYWKHVFKAKLDPDTLCDTIRPIAMPAKKN